MTIATRIGMRWTLQLVITAAILTTWKTSSSGQTSTGPATAEAEVCEAPRRCFHPADFEAAVDAACRQASAIAADGEGLVEDLDRCETQRDVNRGRLIESHENPPAPPPSWRTPIPLLVAVRAAEVLGGATLGWCVGAGCPAEVTVGVAVAAVAAVVGDVVLGWLERRATPPRRPPARPHARRSRRTARAARL